jgi:hypothetical protein
MKFAKLFVAPTALVALCVTTASLAQGQASLAGSTDSKPAPAVVAERPLWEKTRPFQS